LSGVVKRIIEREAQLISSFIRTPRGVFETIDDAIRIVREEVKVLLQKYLGLNCNSPFLLINVLHVFFTW